VKKFGFFGTLIFIFVAMVITYIIDWGEQDVVIQKLVYLIGPTTALVAGAMTLAKIGWQGKRANVVKNVIAALTLWLLAEIVTLYMVWMKIETYPSVADALFLLGYIMFSAAVVSEAKLFDLNWTKLDHKVLAYLGTMFAFMVGLVGYISVLGYNPTESLLASLTTLSWSVGDLIMGGLGLILLAMVWKYRQGTVKRGWLYFMIATLINLIADTIYNLYPNALAEGSALTIVLDAMWTSGYFLMASYFLEIRQQATRFQQNLFQQAT
jgi:hypothetical protein